MPFFANALSSSKLLSPLGMNSLVVPATPATPNLLTMLPSPAEKRKSVYDFSIYTEWRCRLGRHGYHYHYHCHRCIVCCDDVIALNIDSESAYR